MITLSEINEIVKRFNVPAETIEKDYAISWLLVCLSKYKLLESFVFYGGTAIKRMYFSEHRFSEDIDLISSHFYSLETIVEAFDILALAKDEANITFTIKSSEIIPRYDRVKCIVSYDGFNEIMGGCKRNSYRLCHEKRDPWSSLYKKTNRILLRHRRTKSDTTCDEPKCHSSK